MLVKHTALVRLFALCAALSGPASAQEMINGTGFPLNFDMGYGIMTNEGSSLVQTWMVVNDPSLPVSFDVSGYKGLETFYVERGYQYRAKLKLNILQPISAVRIVVIPFDVWNHANRPLALSHISDIAPGSKSLEGTWNAFDETEALSTTTTIAYVDQVRLKDGTIITGDTDFVLDQARKLSAGLEITDITPAKPKSD